jgi:excisionase family DNA binding protein
MQAYPENMNLAKAAQYLGVSPITIKRMLKDREIPAAKIRGRWLFKKTVIDEWLAQNSWSQIKKSLKKREQAPVSSSKKMHPAVARLFAAMDNFDNSGLDPADWDEAKRVIAEEEAKRERELVELAERNE